MRERKRPAHFAPHSSENRSVIVFVTVCAAKRKPILARDDVIAVIRQSWTDADGWVVGRYVIMPDHIHLFCSPATADPPSLRRWVQYWKSLASRKWPRPEEQPVWQLDFWDRQLRTGESYSAKWEYVRNNPVRHGLVRHSDEWPYQGQLNVLWWHDP